MRVIVSVVDQRIKMDTNFDATHYGVAEIPTFSESMSFGGEWHYSFVLAELPSFAAKVVVSRMMKDGAKLQVDPDSKRKLTRYADNLDRGVLHYEVKSQRGVLTAPRCIPYTDLVRRSYGYPRADGKYSIPFEHLTDFIECNKKLPESWQVDIAEEVGMVLHEDIPIPFNGTVESLAHVSLRVLRTVRGNVQSAAMLKTSSDSIEQKFEAQGITNLKSLLELQPVKYIDRTDPQRIGDLIPGEEATIVGKVDEVKSPTPKLTVLRLLDKNGDTIDCTFFNANWIRRNYHEGDELIATGLFQLNEFHGRRYPQLSQPDLDFVDNSSMASIVPMYHMPPKAALSSNVILHCEQELVSRLRGKMQRTDVEDEMLSRHGFKESYADALLDLQFPASMEDVESAKQTMAFIELERLMVYILDDRGQVTEQSGIVQASDESLPRAYIDSLPYTLTGAQSRAIGIIEKGTSSNHRLHALMVGDVGSGKTTVMHVAALYAINAGHQAVICAPTEILARQLYETFMKMFDKMPPVAQGRIHPVFHGAYSGKGSAKARRENLAGIADGSLNLIFGTHSVLNVDYSDLTFVGVDEQHKFGVAQRDRLLKVREDGRVPDMLMQTATPIPRSMAQVYYGDISYIALDEMPAGRQPIKTVWLKEKGQRLLDDLSSTVWADVKTEALKGHGTFIVCPMVNDNEKVDAASVRRTLKRVREILPNVRVEAVYGGQARDKQDSIITGFKNGDVDVLVASSVVEVGVSCEKATRMLILDANRFGVASLHQIRGRIGRASLSSTCYLVGMPFNKSGQDRLQSMVDTLDGWKLSKRDLRTRGSGSLFGTAQSGASDLKFADLMVHAKWIDAARAEAKNVLQGDDAAKAVAEAKHYFGADSIMS